MGRYQSPLIHFVSLNPHNHSMKKVLSFPHLRHDEVTCPGSCSHCDPGSLPFPAMVSLGLRPEGTQSPPQDFCNIQEVCCSDSTFFCQPQDLDPSPFASNILSGAWLGQRLEGVRVLRSHLAVCRTFHHLGNCTASWPFWNNRQNLQLDPFLGPKDPGSSPEQNYQGDFPTKVVSVQVHLQAAKGTIFSFSSSISPKYGAYLSGYWEHFKWHLSEDLYVNSAIFILSFIRRICNQHTTNDFMHRIA